MTVVSHLGSQIVSGSWLPFVPIKTWVDIKHLPETTCHNLEKKTLQLLEHSLNLEWSLWSGLSA